jgi:zinc transporter 5/7
VIISTLLIQLYGWTGFDPIASLFIAILIAASVIPLVADSGKVLCLDVADRDAGIRHALAEASYSIDQSYRWSAHFLPNASFLSSKVWRHIHLLDFGQKMHPALLAPSIFNLHPKHPHATAAQICLLPNK